MATNTDLLKEFYEMKSDFGTRIGMLEKEVAALTDSIGWLSDVTEDATEGQTDFVAHILGAVKLFREAAPMLRSELAGLGADMGTEEDDAAEEETRLPIQAVPAGEHQGA